VPEDVSIVVLDKGPQQTSALAPVSLTGVRLNEWHRGFIAAETLHQLILGKKPERKITLIPPGNIQERASTGHVEAKEPVIAKALSFLRANHHKDIAVPEIVAAAGVSRRTLENRFREILNCSIQQELQRLRIEKAKHHLEEKKLSITRIAEVCGFSSVHYFSGAFKREMGISPRQYQESNSD
jgi:LacI family transcriptional regulator